MRLEQFNILFPILVLLYVMVLCVTYSKFVREEFVDAYIPYSVFEIDDAFTRTECAELCSYMHGKLQRSKVVGSNGIDTVSQDRTSQTAWLKHDDVAQEAFVNKFIRLGARLTGYKDLKFYEDISIVRYQASEMYREHYDACATKRHCQTNDRIYRKATIILYLNDDFEGGETYFPKIGLNVKPKTGKAVLFYNTDDTGQEILESLHAGNPVKSGEKWIATLWIKFIPREEDIAYLDSVA